MNTDPKTDALKIKVLSIEGCANTPLAISCIEELAKELGIPIHIAKLQIKTQEEAIRNRFFGSPTIQINGVDIDPEKRESTAYGIG